MTEPLKSDKSMASTNLSWSRMSQDQKQRREPKAVRPAEKKSLIVAIDQHDSIRFQVTSALSKLSSRFYVWKTVPHAFLAAYPIFGPNTFKPPTRTTGKNIVELKTLIIFGSLWTSKKKASTHHERDSWPSTRQLKQSWTQRTHIFYASMRK